ncbi:hypothetical protein [Zhihengliuella halotolerans]|uniref:hypothetical protein n=1 Tax=Zhihengliuella halotolerans TaxID=370736 RepID=UPI000C7FD835|nr:hypothetical protein [Zhihengliuella halotolerans]
MTACTTTDCQNPTETYLCSQCVSDLQQWIDKVPDLIEELFTTMARQDQVRTGRNGGNGGDIHAPMPIRADAAELRQALHIWVKQDAGQLAHDQHAGNFLPMLRDLIKRAERIIDLPPDETIIVGTCQCGAKLTAKIDQHDVPCTECDTVYDRNTLDDHLRQLVRGEPMRPRQAIEHLRRNANVSIKIKDIKNWVQLGHLGYVLERVVNAGAPVRAYFPGDVLNIHHQMKDRRRRP